MKRHKERSSERNSKENTGRIRSVEKFLEKQWGWDNHPESQKEGGPCITGSRRGSSAFLPLTIKKLEQLQRIAPALQTTLQI